MSANFTPNNSTLEQVSPFRHFCQKVIPLVYDDSLGYYELLCKVTNVLNQTIENNKLLGEDMEKLYEAYELLQGYVNFYFDNLDVQKEINNKLNGMATDGSLSALIQPLFDTYELHINNIIDSQNGEIASLKGRMNVFSSLGEGSTTGDAELMDARVDSNGYSYANVGEHIRNIDVVLSGLYERSNFKFGREMLENSYIDYIGTTYSNNGSCIFTFNVSEYDYIEITENVIKTTPMQYIHFYSGDALVSSVNANDVNGVINVVGISSIKVNGYYTDRNNEFVIPYVKKVSEKTNTVIHQEIVPLIEKNETSAYQWFFKTEDSVIGWVFDLTNIDKIFVSAFAPKAYYNAYTMFDKSGNIIDYTIVYNTDQKAYTLDTRYADKIVVCSQTGTVPKVFAFKELSGTLVGKKAVWFGSSIPWGSADTFKSYPFMVGGLTGMYVYNESYPESCVSASYDNLVNSDNPYGLSENWNRVTREFGGTIESIKWALENYDNAVFKYNAPVSKPTGYDYIKLWAQSYEVKVLRYLSKAESIYNVNYPYGGFVGDVDYYIFNHGHNDDMNYNGEMCFSNKLNAIMDIILKYNPSATIVIIGEYENKTERGQKIDVKLTDLSENRSIPYFKLFNSLGWTNDTIKVMGHWVVNPNGGSDWGDTSTEYEMSVLEANLPDGVHPNFDNSLRATKKIAVACANYLQSL